MGLYDTISGVDEETHDAQVKLWGEDMVAYGTGDRVPPVQVSGRVWADTYSVVLFPKTSEHRPLYVLVVERIIRGVAGAPLFAEPVFTKHGSDPAEAAEWTIPEWLRSEFQPKEKP